MENRIDIYMDEDKEKDLKGGEKNNTCHYGAKKGTRIEINDQKSLFYRLFPKNKWNQHPIVWAPIPSHICFRKSGNNWPTASIFDQERQ